MHVEEALHRYVVSLLHHTRADARLALGASPRAGVALVRASKSLALLRGRGFATADDVRSVAPAVLEHRLLPEPGAGSTSRRRRSPTRWQARRRREVCATDRARRPRVAGAVIAYLAGWAFGTHELAALALALALALPVAVITVSRARRVEVGLVRRLPARTTEGHPVEASILIEPALRLVSAALVERCAGLGDPTARLRHVPGGLVGRWTIDRPDRGRYRLAPELVLEDALGLVRSRIPLDAAGLLRVEPRLVELGAQRSRPLALRDGARHAFRASAGDELAGVRDHQVGESLRRVHWRTTARRGRLTVREVEDHPREELLVLLDAASPGRPSRLSRRPSSAPFALRARSRCMPRAVGSRCRSRAGGAIRCGSV